MSTEKRSAFSRAVRSINPNPRVPDATVSHYSLQLALAELERARETLQEFLRLDEERHLMCDDGGELVSALHDARTLLARLDNGPQNDVQAAIGGLTQTPMEW